MIGSTGKSKHTRSTNVLIRKKNGDTTIEEQLYSHTLGSPIQRTIKHRKRNKMAAASRRKNR